MRWLLEWLADGCGPRGGEGCGPASRLREGATRMRLRVGYHRERAEEARGDFDRASRRVRFLEISEDAEVSELVEAHHELLRARNALDHHERRLRRAREVQEMMLGDLRRLEDGRDPKHRDAYAAELDG